MSTSQQKSFLLSNSRLIDCFGERERESCSPLLPAEQIALCIRLYEELRKATSSPFAKAREKNEKSCNR